MRRAARRAGVIPALLLVALVLAASPANGAQSPPALGFAEIWDSAGQLVGAASFQRVAEGVEIRARFRGLPPGAHGYHVHAVGRCDAPSFSSAGEHFNPTEREHGLQSPRGHHLGDLPNLIVGEDGTASMTAIARFTTLAAGEFSLFDIDGSSLLIHANADDEVTDPSGNSGDAIACGVLGAGPAHDVGGARFIDEPDEVQAMFRAVWGDYAPETWVLERNAEILALPR